MLHELLTKFRKVKNILMNRRIKWTHKVGELAMEVFVIVLAVSLSIWFHNLNEQKHQKEEVTEFLEQMQLDLSKDINSIEHSMNLLQSQNAFYELITNGKYSQNLDLLPKNTKISRSVYHFRSNKAGYESLIQSGKTHLIKDHKLKSMIFEYYIDKLARIDDIGKYYNENDHNVFSILYTLGTPQLSPDISREIEMNNTLVKNNFLPELEEAKQSAKQIVMQIKNNK